MSKKVRLVLWIAVVAALLFVPAMAWAQELEGAVVEEESSGGGMGLWAIIAGSGWLGIVLWSALILDSMAAAYLIIDFFITVSPKRIIPDALVSDVREAMAITSKSLTTVKLRPLLTNLKNYL